MPSETTGLRERKKRETRERIALAARDLFAVRGFDAVRVSDVAEAAGVSEATVFNYFRTKEDIFFFGLEAFEERLLSAIGDRTPGESALAAFGRFVLEPRGLLSARDPAAVEHLAAITRVIAESPALLAYEQRIFDRYTDSLAALLATETGADPGDAAPRVAAHALLGVHRTLIELSRREILAGTRNPALARRVRAQGEQALALLERGLGDYAA